MGAQCAGRRRRRSTSPSAGAGSIASAHELADADKIDVLRAYLRRWKAEVGVFFDGVGPDSTDEELAAIAPRHPVFLLDPVTGE